MLGDWVIVGHHFLSSDSSAAAFPHVAVGVMAARMAKCSLFFGGQ